jgi:hypothetical protein
LLAGHRRSHLVSMRSHIAALHTSVLLHWLSAPSS